MRWIDIKLMIVLFMIIFSSFSYADLMAFQGKALDQGVLVDSGNITVSIYDASSGGSLVYQESFLGVIQGGFFDVVLGNNTPLNLNLGETYWVDLSINGNDIDWQGSERKVFESAVGNVDPSMVLPTCNNGEGLVYNSSSGNWICSSGSEVIPVGSVMAFSQDDCPTGWLEANGSDISRAAYSNLFSAIGTRYGVGDGSTTFNLPDYRGYFLRGADDGAGVDPDAASRTDSGDGTTGDNVGTVQTDGLSSHLHSVDPPSTSSSSVADHSHSVDPPSTGSSSVSGHTHSVDPPSTTSGGNSVGHTHSVNPPSTNTGNQNQGHTHGYTYPNYVGTAASGGGVSLYAASATNTGWQDRNHYHNIDIAAFTSGGASASHTHNTNIAAFTSGSGGGHSHSTDIAPFDSVGAGGHSHTTDIAAFDSELFGGGEVRPKNINVLYCIKATDVISVVDATRFTAAGNNVYLTNLSDNLGVGTNTPSYKLDVGGTGRFTGALTSATMNTGQGNYELYAMDQNVQTSDDVTFATLNTGQGANELYAMDQNVLTTSSPTFVNLNSINSIYGDYGTIARSYDEWLRLNDGGTHTNGIYTNSHFRADGEIRQGSTDYGAFEIQTGGKVYAGGGIYVGDDEYFYRGAEDVIRTDDSIYTTGSIAVDGIIETSDNSEGSINLAQGTFEHNSFLSMSTALGMSIVVGVGELYIDAYDGIRLSSDAIPSISGSNYMCWDGSGESYIGDCSSSGRFKPEEFRKEINLTKAKFLELNPLEFRWNTSSANFREYGFIAEEVADVDPLLASFKPEFNNATGLNETYASDIKHRGISAFNTKMIQELIYDYKDLQEENQEQQKIIDDLKEIICMDHPDTEICN